MTMKHLINKEWIVWLYNQILPAANITNESHWWGEFICWRRGVNKMGTKICFAVLAFEYSHLPWRSPKEQMQDEHEIEGEKKPRISLKKITKRKLLNW